MQPKVIVFTASSSDAREALKAFGWRTKRCLSGEDFMQELAKDDFDVLVVSTSIACTGYRLTPGSTIMFMSDAALSDRGLSNKL